MDIDLDAQFPALSNLARTNGRSLKELSKTAPADDRFLGLSGCCWCVVNDRFSSSYRAAGPYSYLVTLNEFLKKLQSRGDDQRKIWRKITGASSSFLDTIVEITWALHFWNNDYVILLEEPFDLASPSKDADIVLYVGEKKFWLDAVSVKLGSGNLVDKITERAIEKYKNKFSDAVSSGVLQKESVGILLCLVKAEGFILPSLLSFQPAPPSSLFSNRSQGLDFVLIHTLSPDPSGLLQVWPILKWERQDVIPHQTTSLRCDELPSFLLPTG